MNFYSDKSRKIVLATLNAHPEKGYATSLATAKEGNTITDFDESRLKLFANEPTEANEFLSDMINLIGRQLAYDILRTWKNPYDVFMRDAGQYATIDELITAKLSDTSDASTEWSQDEPTNPFSATKPVASDLCKDFVSTRWIRRISKRISEEVWAGAFLTAEGLSTLVGILLKNMRDSISIFIYDQLTADIGDSTKFPKYEVVTKINGVGQPDSARSCYETLMAIVNKMKLPSSAYNKVGFRTVAGPLHLFLNANYKASFDINVVASLFNASAIALEKEFVVHVVDMPSDKATQIGFICDDEAIVMGYRFNTAGSVYNPATAEMNYWILCAIKYGIRSARDAVRLLDATPAGQ